MSNIYVGNGKAKFNGDLISIMLNVDELSKNFKEFGFTTDAGKRMIKIDVKKGLDVDQYGNTHYVIIDQWKPTPQGNTNPHSNSGNVTNAKAVFTDDIPGKADDSEIPF